MTTPLPRVFVALDFANPMHALALADRLDPRACGLKVGKELFVLAGPEPVRWMVERGFPVFLDLKFHDIPNTVAGACRAAARLGVWMLNVHASGGAAMMRAARESVSSFANPPLLIGVTVLTSLSTPDLADVGFSGSAAQNVERLARVASANGLDGIVCSAEEAALVRASLGEGFVSVTPGIRLPGNAKGDQTRIATPEEAVKRGAHYLVLGRPVTQSADPAATLREIARSLADGKATP